MVPALREREFTGVENQSLRAPKNVLEGSKRCEVLTVNGKAAVVVQDAEANRRLLDAAAQADAGEGIRQGLEDVRERRLRPAREFFDEFESRHGIRR